MKEKQPALVVAAAIAETAKTVGRAYVFTSASKAILQQENASVEIAKNKFAEFACADCGTSFDALNELASPFCFCCGSENVQKKEVKASQHIHPDSELISVTCSACASINVTHAAIAKAAKNNMHCSVCGTPLVSLSVEKAEEEKPEGDEVSVDDMDTLDVDEATNLNADKEGYPGNESDTGEMMLSESEDDKDEDLLDEEEEAGDVPEALKEHQFEKKDEEESDAEEDKEEDKEEEEKEEEESAEGTDIPEDLHDELPEGHGEPAKPEAENLNVEHPAGGEAKGGGEPEHLHSELPTQPVKEGGSVKKAKVKADSEVLDTNDAGESDDVEDINMGDMVNDDVEELSIIAMGSKILLASGPYVFASLDETNAGDNKDIFQTTQFQKAVIASLKIDGAKKTMEAFKFSPVIVKANIAKHVQKLVDQKLKAEGVALAKLRETLTADFKQSLDIAVVGLNKSFWKGVQNPLKAALVRELSTLGIRGAEKVVNQLFEQQGVTYASTLIEQATKILSKSKEMRNELATVLDMANSVVGAEGDEDEEDIDGLDTLEASLKPLSPEKADALRREKRELQDVSSTGPSSKVRQIIGGSKEPLFMQ
jgi:ribosomal protein S27E